MHLYLQEVEQQIPINQTSLSSGPGSNEMLNRLRLGGQTLREGLQVAVPILGGTLYPYTQR